jgi:hypothetical protein
MAFVGGRTNIALIVIMPRSHVTGRSILACWKEIVRQRQDGERFVVAGRGPAYQVE